MSLRLPVATLEAMALHVHYEVDRLAFWSCNNIQEHHLRQEALSWPVPWVRNLVGQTTLEAALIHLRVVSDFLMNKRPTNPKWETDVVADDYFDDGWSDRPDYIVGASRDEHHKIIEELNRRLMHLSYQRIDAFEWGQELSYVPAVMEAVTAFIGDLPAGRRQWFEPTRRVAEWRIAVAKEPTTYETEPSPGSLKVVVTDMTTGAFGSTIATSTSSESYLTPGWWTDANMPRPSEP
jgi:hypothetical protein